MTGVATYVYYSEPLWIVIEFPDRVSAEQWYASPAYQDIVKLRTANAESNVFLIDGVDRDHRATDVLA